MKEELLGLASTATVLSELELSGTSRVSVVSDVAVAKLSEMMLDSVASVRLTTLVKLLLLLMITIVITLLATDTITSPFVKALLVLEMVTAKLTWVNVTDV